MKLKCSWLRLIAEDVLEFYCSVEECGNILRCLEYASLM
jgi:hypothetical protein